MPYEDDSAKTCAPSVLTDIASELEKTLAGLRQVLAPVTSVRPIPNPTEATNHLPEVLQRLKAGVASLRDLRDSIVV